MEADGEQNASPTNGNAASGGSSRPAQISQMSLYERQAVQALQALHRQPNAAQAAHAAQYFQLLQQQINNAQLHNLAAQATLAASRQSSSPSNNVSQSTSAAHCTVNQSSSGGGTMTNPRPIGPVSSATTSALNQSVLLGGNTAAQGQMFLRVNRSLRAPLSQQLIFMPGGTATAAVATVAQQQPQQQQEVTPTSSSSQTDNDQVQNLAMRCASSPRVTGVKTEPDRKDSACYSLVQQPSQQTQPFSQSTQQSTGQQPHPGQQQIHNKMSPYSQPSTPTLPNMNPKNSGQSSMAPPPAPPLPPSSSPSSSLPISQLLLSPSGFCQARTVTTVTSAATATHILVPTSNTPSPSQGFPVTTATAKPLISAQTLVVQPLQQSSEKMSHTSGPIPIQPKTVQGLRLPLQLPPRHPPPILPAPPTSQGYSHLPPHVPVQLVGARQGSLGTGPQALALAQPRNCCTQDGSSSSSMATADGAALKSPQTALPLTQTSQVHLPPGQGAALNSVSSPPPSLNAASHSDLQGNPPVTPSGEPVYAQCQGKTTSSLKRKSDCDGGVAADPLALPMPSTRALSPGTSSPTDEGVNSTPALSLCRAGGERAPPPQAVVKPQVLTHLIEGFVIQEGAEPFPVGGPVKEQPEGALAVTVPSTGQAESDAAASRLMKCEYCEGYAPANQFRGSKRFCSMTCAKRYNVSCSHQFRSRRGRGPRGGTGGPEGGLRRRGPRRSSSEIACAKIAGRHLSVKCRSESSRSEEVSSCEEEEEDSLSPGSSFSCPRPAHCGPQVDGSTSAGLAMDSGQFLSGSPSLWSVEEVCQFISSLQGCEDLAGQFLSQEIDGQALLLLREEHLMSTMNIKLGPALKICASINSLKD